MFTVAEDVKILNFWRKEKEKLSMIRIAEKMARTLRRPKDSVRDRIRRYLARLNDSEVASMMAMHAVDYPDSEKPGIHCHVSHP